jgi:hypothetical protein
MFFVSRINFFLGQMLLNMLERTRAPNTTKNIPIPPYFVPPAIYGLIPVSE